MRVRAFEGTVEENYGWSGSSGRVRHFVACWRGCNWHGFGVGLSKLMPDILSQIDTIIDTKWIDLVRFYNK